MCAANIFAGEAEGHFLRTDIAAPFKQFQLPSTRCRQKVNMLSFLRQQALNMVFAY
jgi:hypothetical protein